MIDLSIVVPTHKRLKSVLRLLQSLEEQDVGSLDVEILIIANQSDDPILAQNLNGFNFKIKVLCAGKIGVNAARNMGLAQSQGSLLLFIDDDCIIEDKSYFEKIVHFHDKFKNATVIGGVYEIHRNAAPIDKAYFAIGRSWQTPHYYGACESTRLVGGNVSYKKEKLIAENLFFDEEIVFGGTEYEFHNRLYAKQHELLLFENMKVIHYTKLSVEQIKLKAIKQAATNNLYNIKDPFKSNHFRSYHDVMTILLLNIVKDVDEFVEVQKYIEVYKKHFIEERKLSLVRKEFGILRWLLNKVLLKDPCAKA